MANQKGINNKRLKDKKPRPRYSGANSAFAIIMKHRNLTNADIARYMAVNQRTVIKWFNNPFALTLRQLTQLAGLFTCTPEFLVHCLSINNAQPTNQNIASEAIKTDAIKFNITI